MSNGSSKKGLIKLHGTSIERYSNALVRRAIEDIKGKNPSLINSTSKKWRAGHAPLIALADDEPLLTELLSSELQEEGFLTIAFTHKEKLLEEMQQKRLKPDAIITDLYSPWMDGFEFISAVKSNTETNRITIIVLTSGGCNDRDAKKALRLGAADFFCKPYEFEEILASLSRVGVLKP